MSALATQALRAAMAGYALGLAALLLARCRGGERLRRAGLAAALLAWIAHGASTVAHWIASGHAPVTGHFEGGLTAAWFLPLLAGLAIWRHREAARALPLVLGATLAVLAVRGEPPDLGPLAPPFRSSWLVFHVLFARVAFGAYLVATALAACYLWLSRRAAGSALVLEELSGKLVAFGFLSHAGMLLSGALWAHDLWGRYWGWDPLETWSLVSWLVYGVYLHLRYTLGWAGRRSAWAAVLSVLALLATFYGIGAGGGLHVQTL
ncbi:cytochrome c biogenesis protein [Anaeromyxobacter paludicola]|uniref:C-type cytochrome biogenesis protein CcsB n=1 Tax=Anaeromyxobacter paludicola TaxID=2918171 RepID=A0ABM7XAG2_9BACT|nr:cytochrome c biogenesis protein CcsA [Anaeromyxobacter paludicola]BDG08844.1 c-type cytochrome biogenesis protein CcsB [Anaeromyxobacter paludicola]